MDDPLSLFKEFVKTRKPIFLENNGQKIAFGEIRFDSQTTVSIKNEELQLAQIWFYLKHCDKTYVEYLNECRKHKMNKVSISLQSDLKSMFLIDATTVKPSQLFLEKNVDQPSSTASSASAAAVASAAAENESVDEQQQQQQHATSTLDASSEQSLSSSLKRKREETATAASQDETSDSAHQKDDKQLTATASSATESAMSSEAKRPRIEEAHKSRTTDASSSSSGASATDAVSSSQQAAVATSRDAVSIKASTDASLNEKQLESKQAFGELLDKVSMIAKDHHHNASSSKSSQKMMDDLDAMISVDALTPFLQYDQTILKKLKRRELASKKTFSLHARTGTAGATSKANFSYITTKILPKVKMMEVERKKQEEADKKQKARLDKESNYDAANIQIHAQVRSRRYNEDSIWKSSVGAEFDEFQIDPMGSNLGLGGSSASGLGSQMETTSSSAEVNEQEQLNQAKRAAQQQVERRSQSQQQPKKRKVPIIIVPPALSSLITLYNVKSFLQNGQFITTEEQRQNGSTKPDYVIVQRQTKQQTVEDFLIIDNVNKLSKEDWSRVIAVFVTGQSWQFRGWFSEDPTVVLNKIKGFHVKYTDDPVNENIAKWPVTVLDISKNQTKRHMDRTLTRIFWEKALNK